MTDDLLAACRTFYAARPTLTALVPASALFVGTVPPDVALPWGVLARVHVHATECSGGTRIETDLVQFSFFADSVATLDQLADALRTALAPTAVLPIVGGTVLGSYLDDDRILPERRERGPGAPAHSPWVFGLHLTYRFLVSRPT